ncbi:MAG: hypothetical protein M1812_005056 [Candelaria pacifica]|nr:MAG: hypothetical protein M1812_005056 [Candelaria pacifica]
MRLNLERVSVNHVPVDVPPELLITIFKYLPKSDIKSVRLVCKEFEATASLCLIDRVYISTLSVDIKIFLEIQQHPVFSKTARELVWYDDYYFIELGYITETLHNPDFDPDAHEWDETFLSDLKERDSVLQSGADFSALCTGLASMKGLNCITLVDSQEDAGDYHPPGLRPKRPQKSGWPMYLEPGPVWRRKYSPFRGFINLIHAMSIVRPAAREFTVKSKTGLPTALFLEAQLDLRHMCNAFQNLSKIELSLNSSARRYVSRHPSEVYFEESGNFSETLLAASRLESLTLTAGWSHSWGADTYTRPHLRLVLGTGSWPFLRHLQLSYFSTTQDEIAALIYRHVRTLRSIYMFKLWLSDGSWCDLLATMRLWSVYPQHLQIEQYLDPVKQDCQFKGASFGMIKYYLENGGLNPLAPIDEPDSDFLSISSEEED